MCAGRPDGAFIAADLVKAPPDLEGAGCKGLIHPGTVQVVIVRISGVVKVSFNLHVVVFIVHGQGAIAVLSVGYSDVTGFRIHIGRPVLKAVIPAHNKRTPVNQEHARFLNQTAVDGQRVTVQVNKSIRNISVAVNDTVLCQGRG